MTRWLVVIACCSSYVFRSWSRQAKLWGQTRADSIRIIFLSPDVPRPLSLPDAYRPNPWLNPWQATACPA